MITDKICTNCYVALYEPHPELIGWWKCELCCYCIKVKK